MYNSHILEFSFPLILYKKLVRVKPTLHDLKVCVPALCCTHSPLLH